jgi:hypothetical protein
MAPPMPDGVSKLVKLVIKNPASGGPGGFTLENVSPEATLAQVQLRLQQEYDGNPTPEQQTVGGGGLEAGSKRRDTFTCCARETRSS